MDFPREMVGMSRREPTRRPRSIYTRCVHGLLSYCVCVCVCVSQSRSVCVISSAFKLICYSTNPLICAFHKELNQECSSATAAPHTHTHTTTTTHTHTHSHTHNSNTHAPGFVLLLHALIRQIKANSMACGCNTPPPSPSPTHTHTLMIISTPSWTLDRQLSSSPPPLPPLFF